MSVNTPHEEFQSKMSKLYKLVESLSKAEEDFSMIGKEVQRKSNLADQDAVSLGYKLSAASGKVEANKNALKEFFNAIQSLDEKQKILQGLYRQDFGQNQYGTYVYVSQPTENESAISIADIAALSNSTEFFKTLLKLNIISPQDEKGKEIYRNALETILKRFDYNGHKEITDYLVDILNLTMNDFKQNFNNLIKIFDSDKHIQELMPTMKTSPPNTIQETQPSQQKTTDSANPNLTDNPEPKNKEEAKEDTPPIQQLKPPMTMDSTITVEALLKRIQQYLRQVEPLRVVYLGALSRLWNQLKALFGFTLSRDKAMAAKRVKTTLETQIKQSPQGKNQDATQKRDELLQENIGYVTNYRAKKDAKKQPGATKTKIDDKLGRFASTIGGKPPSK